MRNNNKKKRVRFLSDNVNNNNIINMKNNINTNNIINTKNINNIIKNNFIKNNNDYANYKKLINKILDQIKNNKIRKYSNYELTLYGKTLFVRSFNSDLPIDFKYIKAQVDYGYKN
jgi:hypothetical protein